MRAAWLIASLALVALPVVASANEGDVRPKPTKEEQREAAKKFKEGERAYAKHDYAAAAQAFEEAYKLAPHPDVLLNAIDARKKGGDLRVAAEHCQRLLSEFPDGKPASDARKRLAELTPKLGRLEIVAKGNAQDIRIDQKPAVLGEVFVDPGDHVVVATFDGKEVETRASVVAGSRATVLLEPPKPEPPPPPPEEKSWGPLGSPIPAPVFFTGLGLTVVFGSVLIWSGVDTDDARAEFDKNPTRKAYEDGLSKEQRTNAFVGVTATLAAATAVIAIFTDWDFGKEEGPVDLRTSFGPGWVGVEGSF